MFASVSKLAATLVAFAVVMAPAVTSTATADPDIDTESAASVIDDLKEQGYDVRIDGVSGDNTDLLAGCRVTSIRDSGQPSTDPTKTTLLNVSIACPIQHG